MVRSSVDDTPESDAAARSGAAEMVGAVVSMVIDSAALAVDRFPATSVAVEVMLWTPEPRAVATVKVQLPDASAVVVPTRVAPS